MRRNAVAAVMASAMAATLLCCWLVTDPSFDAGVEGGSDALGMDASCEADLTGDPNHCGSCGHSCQGGVCEAGVCLPIILADAEPLPVVVVVDDTTIYWTNYKIGDAGGNVRAMPKDGGTPVTLIAGQPSAASLALDQDHVYWITQPAGPSTGYVNDGVFRMLKDGGSPQMIFDGGSQPQRVVVDDSYVYWSDNLGQVCRTVKSGGGQRCVIANAQDAGLVTGTGNGIDLDTHVGVAQAVYWTTEAPDGGVGAVWSASPQCQTTVPAKLVIQRGPASPFFLAFTSPYIYWSEVNTSESVNRISPDGTNYAGLAGQTADRYEFGLRDGFIYWSGGTKATSGVWATRVDGGPQIVYAAPPYTDIPQGMAVDDCCLYWVDLGLHAILKVAR